jgi:hypothetical protein
MPCISGKKPKPHAGAHSIGGSIPELQGEGLKKEIEIAEELGFENYVFASAWSRNPKGGPSKFSKEKLLKLFPRFKTKEAYEISNFLETCGDYVPKKSRFPEGIKAFSEDLLKSGIKMGVWIDPRINRNTEFYEPNKDILIEFTGNSYQDEVNETGLIDLSVESGRQYMLELLEKFIVDYGAGFIWHDLNDVPQKRYFNKYEESNRKGLKKLRYWQGCDMVYDEIRRRHPDVWIEWCGGGGSMINLGILRRAHSLFISDYSDFNHEDYPGCTVSDNLNTDISRSYRTCLNWIFPSGYISNFMNIDMINKYGVNIGMNNLLSQFGSAFSLNKLLMLMSDKNKNDIKKAVKVFKSVRHFLHKDYWSLFPIPKDRLGWDGWQFHDPESGSGIILLFKRIGSKNDTETIKPNWLGKGKKIDVKILIGEGEIVTDSGNWAVTMTDMALLCRYSQKG